MLDYNKCVTPNKTLEIGKQEMNALTFGYVNENNKIVVTHKIENLNFSQNPYKNIGSSVVVFDDNTFSVFSNNDQYNKHIILNRVKQLYDSATKYSYGKQLSNYSIELWK